MKICERNISYALITFLIVVISTITINAQLDDSKPLAKVGNQIITVEEFSNRFEFMPHLNYSDDNPDTLKREFLYSLIAEKLWAMEALQKRVDTLEVIQQSIKTLEKLFVKDELFRKEVESRIQLSSEEIAKGLLKVPRTLSIYLITSQDSNEIFSIHKILTANNFDSLLSTRPEFVSQQKPIEIKLGTLGDENIEDVVFNLKLQEFSKPLKSDSKWFIIKVVNEQIDSSLFQNNETARNKVISILTERKRKKIAGNFLDQLLGGRTISANNELFAEFSDKLIQVLNKRFDKINIQDSNQNFELTSSDLSSVLRLIEPAKLNSLFVEFDNTKLSLKDFIYYLMYQKISFPSLKPNRIKLVIHSAVKQFIEDEIIVAEGYKSGLNRNLSVIKDIEMWKNYYLSEIMMQKFADSVLVTESEIDDYISKKIKNASDQIMLNIIEIFTYKLDDMMNVLNELNKGKSFKELAKQYNQREYTKASYGEWGNFLANSAGEIGRVASNMKIGEIYGPIKVQDGYSIFQLIDKKSITDSVITFNDEPKDYIRMKLSLTKVNELINKNTFYLAEKYGVEIDEQLLSRIELSPLNMFTYKLIGFGGKIAAMPVTIPIFEWYYLKSEKEIP